MASANPPNPAPIMATVDMFLSLINGVLDAETKQGIDKESSDFMLFPSTTVRWVTFDLALEGVFRRGGETLWKAGSFPRLQFRRACLCWIAGVPYRGAYTVHFEHAGT
jgi:hypothetical protein